MSDLFISYSRQDQAFVRRLYDALTARKHNVFVDWESIPASAEWMREIQDAIVKSDAILFILSPDFAASQTCRTELALAEQNKKRLIPIVYHDVAPQDIPETLAKLNWIFMRDSDDFENALATVETAVATDLDYVHSATRLLVRAKQWEDKKENASLLLRGSELKDAETWLAGSGGREPAPSQMHTHYIVASRQASSRRQRSLIGVLSVVVALMVILTSTTLVFYRQANENAATANIRALAAQSLTTTFGSNLDQRLLLSLLAVHKGGSDLRYEAHNSLLTLLQSNSDILGYLHTPNAHVGDGPIKLAESDDGKTLASYSRTGLFVWNLTQQPITPRSIPLPHLYDALDDALFVMSADGHYAVVSGNPSLADADGLTTIVDLTAGQVVAAYPGFAPGAIALSDDGKELAASDFSSDGDRIVETWSLGGDPQNPSAQIVIEHDVSRLAFNNTGTLLALGQGSDGTMMWNLTTNRVSQIATIDVSDISSNSKPEDGLAFSDDGDWFVVSGTSSIGQGGQTAIFKVDHDTLTLADTLPEAGEITRPQSGGFYLASCVDILVCTKISFHHVSLGTFSIGDNNTLDGVGLFAHIAGGASVKPLAISTDNGSILLWQQKYPDYDDAQELPETNVPEAFLSPNGQVVAHFHDDHTLGLWNAQTLKELDDKAITQGLSLLTNTTLQGIEVSNDGAELAVLEKAGQIRIHRRTGVTTLADTPPILTEPINNIPHNTDALDQLAFDWSGSHIAALTCVGPQNSCEKTEVDIWDTNSGKRIAQREFPNAASITFTPDGKTLAVGQLNDVSFYDFVNNAVTSPLDVGDVGIIDGLGFDPTGKMLGGLSYSARGLATPYGGGSSLTGYRLLWDVPTGKQLGLIESQSYGTGVAFDQQGNEYILDAGFIDSYDYSIQAMTKAACAIANRNLTRDEWTRFAGDEPYVKLCANLP